MNKTLEQQLQAAWDAVNKPGDRQPEIFIIKGIWLHADHPGHTSDDQGVSYRALTDAEKSALKPWLAMAGRMFA